MGVVRKWVFPVLRLVIFLAIAIALVKVAFFPDLVAATNPDKPSAEIVEPQYTVGLGSVQNDVTLTGTVAADAAVPIKATLAGEVRKLLVSPGQHVDAGTPILTLRAEVPSADGTTTSIKTATVTAPTAGTLSSFPALVGQLYSVGDTVGQVAPPSFHVSGSLDPAQLYRLIVQPTEAQVTITGGPAPFACTGLSITTPLAGQDSGDGAASGPTVTCSVPADVVVFGGLSANIVIAGGVADNVIVVPTTAVEGVAETGNVYFVLPDGSTEVRPVALGLNDGFTVEIKEGLAEGDVILQYVPGASAVDPNSPGFGGPVPIDGGCMTDGAGNTTCVGIK